MTQPSAALAHQQYSGLVCYTIDEHRKCTPLQPCIMQWVPLRMD